MLVHEPGPSPGPAARSSGRSVEYPHDQELRNQRWGRTCNGARLGPAVDGRDPAEDVFLVGLGILDEDVEVAARPEGVADRVEELELALVLGSGAATPRPAGA